jgi:hypothetical protein
VARRPTSTAAVVLQRQHRRVQGHGAAARVRERTERERNPSIAWIDQLTFPLIT